MAKNILFPKLYAFVSGSLAAFVAVSVLAISNPVQAEPDTGSIRLSQALAEGETSDGFSEDLEEQPTTFEEFIRDLEITEEQGTEIQGIFAEYQPQIEVLIDEYQMALEQLNDVLTPTSSNTLIVDTRNQAVSLERQIYDLFFERNMAIREVLTVDQRAEINRLIRALLDLGNGELVVEFPLNLIGQDADAAIADLQAQGWEVVIRTPTSAQLDRDGEELDLDIDRGGEITEVYYR
mgnify:CR=1 FL=1